MLSTFLSALPSSLALLWTSYGSPGGISAGAKIIEYKSILPLSDYLRGFEYTDIQGNGSGSGISVSMDGGCYIGLRRVGCEDQLVGRLVSKTIPFLLSYQIYYSLLTYTLLLGVLYHYMVHKKWANKIELIKLRRFILVVMVIKDFIGVFGVILSSLSLLLLPLIDQSIDHIIDVKLGWGMILSIFVVFGSGLFVTCAFEFWSKELLRDQVENGIILDDESINDIESRNIMIDEKIKVEVERVVVEVIDETETETEPEVENEIENENEDRRRSVRDLFDSI